MTPQTMATNKKIEPMRKVNNIITTSENKSRKNKRSIRAEKRRATEAKARRKVSEEWQHIELTCKYRQAVAKIIGMNTTDRIAAEVLDGILLNLSARNSDKSPTEQKRLLRRIVEKRQAQAMHRSGYGRDRKSDIAVIQTRANVWNGFNTCDSQVDRMFTFHP